MARALQPALTRSRAWALGSQARTPLQDVRLSRSGSTIADGAGDALGDVDAGGTAYVYTLHNDGADALTVASVASSALSNVTSATVSGISTPVVVAPGGSTTFTVTVTPAAAGACSYTLTVTSDDPDAEAVYTVSVSGTGVEAEINVLNPAAGSVADAGSYAADGGTEGVAAVQTWTIQNTGTAALTSVSVALANKVNCTATVTDSPATSIAASGSDTFDVTVTPTAAGAWSFDIDITSSDANEGNYDIGVSGTAASAYSITHAASLDGVDEHLKTAARETDLERTAAQAFTIWCRVKTTDTSAGLVCIQNGTVGIEWINTTGAQEFTRKGSGTATRSLGTGTKSIVDNAWHFAAVRCTGGTDNSTMDFFVDGTAYAGTSSTNNLVSVTYDANTRPTIGASAAGAFRRLLGSITDCGFATVALSDSDLTSIMNGADPSGVTGVTHSWSFSESGDDMTGATGAIQDHIGSIDFVPQNTESGDRITYP